MAPSPNSVGGDLICPITQHLPFVPVIAEDGVVYERSAIEAYFQTKGDHGAVKSPYQGTVMGRKLIPTPRIKSLIETLIDNGSITGDLVTSWKQKDQEKKTIEDLLQKAEDGDVEAMFVVGESFCYGVGGFRQNEDMALKWFDRARQGGSAMGKLALGALQLRGGSRHTMDSEDSNLPWSSQKKIGFMYVCEAAGEGLDLAAYFLGKCFGKGRYGIPRDDAEAIRWLKKSLSEDCAICVMDEEDRCKAEQQLRKALNEDHLED